MATITSPSKAPLNLYPVQALEIVHNELDPTTAFLGLTACVGTGVQTINHTGCVYQEQGQELTGAEEEEN